MYRSSPGATPKALRILEDVLAQVRFLDKESRPYSLHQFVLGDDLPAVANKNEERFEGLWRDRDGLIFAQQDLFIGVDLKGAEFVENFDSRSHTSSDVEPFLADMGTGGVLDGNLPGSIFELAAILPLIGENGPRAGQRVS